LNGKNFLAATMLTALMLALMFIPMSGSQASKQYDPWMDINDDGRIDMRDITQLCINFMATGDPTKQVVINYKWVEWNVTADLSPSQSFTFENSTGGYGRFTLSVAGWTQSSSAASHDWLYIIICLKVKDVTIIEEVVKIHPYWILQPSIWPPPEGITYRGFTKTYQVDFSEVSVTLYADINNYAPINAIAVCYLTT
jgi:hypothetical protein